MTFRHLGAMTSGYARPEPPGAAWSYNDYAIQLYQKTLFDRVYQEPPEKVVAAPDRFGALGLEDGLKFRKQTAASLLRCAICADRLVVAQSWPLGRAAIDPRAVRRMSPAASAGRLAEYRQGQDRRLSGHWHVWWRVGSFLRPVQASMASTGGSTQLAASTQALTWPDAPADTYMSIGLRGNCTAMMPGLRLVVVRANGDWGKVEPGNAAAVMNQRLRSSPTRARPCTTDCEARAAPVRQRRSHGRGRRSSPASRRNGTPHDHVSRTATSETASPNPFLDSVST